MISFSLMAQLPGTRQLVLETLALRFQPLVLACTMAKQGAKKAAKNAAAAAPKASMKAAMKEKPAAKKAAMKEKPAAAAPKATKATKARKEVMMKARKARERQENRLREEEQNYEFYRCILRARGIDPDDHMLLAYAETLCYFWHLNNVLPL